MATLGEYLGAGSGTTKLLLHLNGNSTDSSGNGNNGTDTNITYSQANGKFGQGAGFNGTSSFISLGTNSDINTLSNSNFTVSMWVKISTLNTLHFFIRTRKASMPQLQWSFYKGDNNKINAYFFNVSTAGGSGSYINGNFVFETNKWTNVILTRGTGGVFSIYVNGSYDSQITYNHNLADSTSTSVLGYAQVETTGYLNGSMDEVIIEARAWTASEIKKYFTNAKGRFHL